MGRSLRTVCFGWSIGFALALATAGLTNRTGNPRLSAALFTTAATLALLVAVLVGIAAAAERLSTRGSSHAARTAPVRATRPQHPSTGREAGTPNPAAVEKSLPAQPTATVGPDHSAAGSADDETAARIALLEARLALEEQQLQAAAEALAATDAEAAARGDRVLATEETHPEAAELEAALRQELLDTVAQLASSTPPDSAAADGETLREAG